MQLVATASKEVKWKNILLVLLCAVFTIWFGYDGLIGWPKVNDATVATIKAKATKDREEGREPLVDQLAKNENTKAIAVALEKWAPKDGWNNASEADKKEVGRLMGEPYNQPYSWHTPLDIFWQKMITLGLAIATLGAIWYYFRCQKRRVVATDATLSPAPGIEFSWDAITEVDNTKWNKSRIVYVTYKDAAGAAHETVLDEYHLDNLRPILQELANRAQNANFIPPPEAAPEADAAQKPEGDAAKQG